KNVNDIYTSKVFENAKETKRKKKLTAIEKAILRYGASKIIDLSIYIKEWFCVSDKKFISKNHESLLQIPELAAEESSFVAKIENLIRKGKVDQAYEYCMDTHIKSDKDSFLYKISKIYSNFKDRENILDFSSETTHTEIDIILKACAYIVEGLNKNLKVYSIWGESFCLLSKNTGYMNRRKCDVRSMSEFGIDVGEWKFSVKAITNKTIGDRCHSAHINQSILNRLLEYNFNDKQVKNIQVPFLQFGGTNIGKLKTAISVIKIVVETYEKVCETIENLETFHHKFDDIFNEDYHIIDKPTHFKYQYIHKPWWTPKNYLFA
ncbi:2493_t:CDS:2, partial [Racocetra persica]